MRSLDWLCIQVLTSGSKKKWPDPKLNFWIGLSGKEYKGDTAEKLLPTGGDLRHRRTNVRHQRDVRRRYSAPSVAQERNSEAQNSAVRSNWGPNTAALPRPREPNLCAAGPAAGKPAVASARYKIHLQSIRYFRGNLNYPAGAPTRCQRPIRTDSNPRLPMTGGYCACPPCYRRRAYRVWPVPHYLTFRRSG